jgi:hypothetical protein
MKLLTRIFSILILASVATFYMSCDGGGGDSQTEEQKQFTKLSSTWALVSANDGTDRTDDFDNLVLTLSGTFAQGGTFQYSFTGTRPNPSPWPANGTWQFGTNPSTELVRDPNSGDEIDLDYEVTDTQLEIRFNLPESHSGWAGSRVESVSGDWTFVFEKQ